MHTTPTALIAVAIAGLAAGTAAPQDADKAAPTVKHVMATMTVPASDAIFSAAWEPPKEMAQWVALEAHAKTLAESGRILTKTTRLDDQEWIQMARALVTEADATLRAVEARKPDALEQAGDTLLSTCKTCHDRFMGR